MITNVEFKVGDKVTFKPYGKEYKAIVKEVLTQGHLFSGDVHYNLSGDKGVSLITTTTGRSILESKYYDDSKFTWN